jgi:hypothetical protein
MPLVLRLLFTSGGRGFRGMASAARQAYRRSAGYWWGGVMNLRWFRANYDAPGILSLSLIAISLTPTTVVAQGFPPCPADQAVRTECNDAFWGHKLNQQNTGNGLKRASAGIPIGIEGGTFIVPVTINDKISLNFTIDSGAADVAVPADVVLTLIRTGSIAKEDFLGEQQYQLADGSIVPSQIFLIRSLKVGDKILKNVRASVASVKGTLLLGQSFLNRFNSWSIDNRQRLLFLDPIISPAPQPAHEMGTIWEPNSAATTGWSKEQADDYYRRNGHARCSSDLSGTHVYCP